MRHSAVFWGHIDLHSTVCLAAGKNHKWEASHQIFRQFLRRCMFGSCGRINWSVQYHQRVGSAVGTTGRNVGLERIFCQARYSNYCLQWCWVMWSMGKIWWRPIYQHCWIEPYGYLGVVLVIKHKLLFNLEKMDLIHLIWSLCIDIERLIVKQSYAKFLTDTTDIASICREPTEL